MNDKPATWPALIDAKQKTGIAVFAYVNPDGSINVHLVRGQQTLSVLNVPAPASASGRGKDEH